MSKKAARKKAPSSNPAAERNVDRLVRILEWVGSRRGEFTRQDLAQATGLSNPTLRRWLEALESRGMVSKKLETSPSRLRGSGYKLRSHVRLVRKKGAA